MTFQLVFLLVVWPSNLIVTPEFWNFQLHFHTCMCIHLTALLPLPFVVYRRQIYKALLYAHAKLHNVHSLTFISTNSIYTSGPNSVTIFQSWPHRCKLKVGLVWRCFVCETCRLAKLWLVCIKRELTSESEKETCLYTVCMKSKDYIFGALNTP